MRRALRNIARLRAILRTLGRHGALFPLDGLDLPLGLPSLIRLLGGRVMAEMADQRPGIRLARALEALGPAFIKLGQALSVRSDLVGDALAADLALLRDRLPPFPAEEARATVAAELGAPVETLFQRFDPDPVAAASIAQVHRALTTDGEEVAVKVLRPGIEAAFARDVELVMWLAEMIERRQPALRRLRPVEAMHHFAVWVDNEMDLRLEAAAADELRAAFVDDPTFDVPAVDWTRTGQRALTIGWVDGIPINDREALVAAGHSLETVVAGMAKVVFLQVFRDGFFHADLHPGNLFIRADGAVVAVDFGIMGRLDRTTRRYLAEMLLGFLTGDYHRVAAVHFRAGYVPADQSLEAFAQAARAIAEPIFGRPLGEISLARLLAQLFKVAQRFKMETQPQLLLLQKTMLVAEGVGRTLYPKVNMWELARPLIENWMRETMRPEARLGETLADAGQMLERLPTLLADMESAVATVARDGVKLHPEALAGLQGGRRGRRWSWLVAGAAVAALVLSLAA
jgi:ubiquinone biosynthesis protein